MLLVHQAGSVKVGEVVRYTVTYTPSLDRILPSPSYLYVRIKNASPVPLRAAYLHGPYTLHVSAYPSTFNPNKKLESPRKEGVPEFEPNLKAGGNWHARLTIPDDIRESGEKSNIKRNTDGSPRTVTWIIEVASQILFSNTAAVHYEFLVGRDERSLDIGFAAIAGKGHGEPGQITDFQHRERTPARRETQPRGVYSRAIDIVVEDTAALWNKPPLPQWEDKKSQLPTDEYSSHHAQAKSDDKSGSRRKTKPKKVHLVVLTHGLHSNVGADLLYMKESIDAAAKEAREAAKKTRREKSGKERTEKQRSKEFVQHDSTTHDPEAANDEGIAPTSGGQDTISDDESDEDSQDEDDEEVIVRGFSGNSCRTERGIQYLGKRLAKFVLTTTYPDQPFLPATKKRSMTGPFGSSKNTSKYGTAVHHGSKIIRADSTEQLPYTFSSISFIGHSLGGLVQTYAVAYIHKHSPQFFEQIKPKNFVSMATPMLGLSNENPLYVKFALDFGLVGRTGQDLGLTWRAPTIARGGWGAMIAGFGAAQEKQTNPEDPRAKPLLRILPTGPAHQVLKMFRNRTLYSNVVNDGIVPLRTSCLLFLDWRGLDKVENAQRENGLIGTMAAFGWAELTGANSTAHRPSTASSGSGSASMDNQKQTSGRQSRQTSTASRQQPSQMEPQEPRIETDVPQPSQNQAEDKLEKSPPSSPLSILDGTQLDDRSRSSDGRLQSRQDSDAGETKSYTLPDNPLTNFINYFRPSFARPHSSQPRKLSKKAVKTYKRAQTMKLEPSSEPRPDEEVSSSNAHRPFVTRGDSIAEDPNARPPPKTSIFTAASDILNPPIPPQSWLIDPSQRDRTIFHDRIYHPEDIPPPPVRRPRLSRSFSSSSLRSNRARSVDSGAQEDLSSMKVEEKIARAYHDGMAWRKVLVRLEPDAHNNMIVRRMFANSYGWDVVKHLCDTHFANTYAARTQDDEEPLGDRAKPMNEPVTEDGEEVRGQTKLTAPPPSESAAGDRTFSEASEASDKLADLHRPILETANLSSSFGSSKAPPKLRHKDSNEWTDSVFDDGEDADDTDDERTSPFDAFQRFWRGAGGGGTTPKEKELGAMGLHHRGSRSSGVSRPAVAHTLSQEPAEIESHRGLGAKTVRQRPGAAAVSPVADAEAIEPLMAEDARPSTLADSPKSVGGTSGLGLRKPPEAHVGEGGTAEHAGVSEQVARLSLESMKGES